MIDEKQARSLILFIHSAYPTTFFINNEILERMIFTWSKMLADYEFKDCYRATENAIKASKDKPPTLAQIIDIMNYEKNLQKTITAKEIVFTPQQWSNEKSGKLYIFDILTQCKAILKGNENDNGENS